MRACTDLADEFLQELMQQFVDVSRFLRVRCQGGDFLDEMHDPVRFGIDDCAVEHIPIGRAYIVVLGRIGQAGDAGDALDDTVNGFLGSLRHFLPLVAFDGLDISVGEEDDAVAMAAFLNALAQGSGNAEPVDLGRIDIREILHPFPKGRIFIVVYRDHIGEGETFSIDDGRDDVDRLAAICRIQISFSVIPVAYDVRMGLDECELTDRRQVDVGGGVTGDAASGHRQKDKGAEKEMDCFHAMLTNVVIKDKYSNKFAILVRSSFF